MYGFSYAELFYFYQHGHDAAHAPQSVGLALMALTIRAATEEGASEFDMLWGAEPYKALWAREARVLQRADLFPLRLRGAVHRHAVAVQRGVSQLARRVLSLGSPGAVRGSEPAAPRATARQERVGGADLAAARAGPRRSAGARCRAPVDPRLPPHRRGLRGAGAERDAEHAD